MNQIAALRAVIAYETQRRGKARALAVAGEVAGCGERMARGFHYGEFCQVTFKAGWLARYQAWLNGVIAWEEQLLARLRELEAGAHAQNSGAHPRRTLGTGQDRRAGGADGLGDAPPPGAMDVA